MHRNPVKPARSVRPKRRHIPPKRHLDKCPVSGKIRFRDKREALDALHYAVATRRLMETEGQVSRRQECRVYACPSCSGWHLTSKPADRRRTDYVPSAEASRFDLQLGAIERGWAQ